MMNRLQRSNDTMRRGGRAQRGFLSSRQAFVLLGLLFLAPTFVAWVMHHSGEQGWRPEGTTNRGMLVHPARPLTLPADLLNGAQPLNLYLQGLWTLVYLGDGDCDAVCNENLYKMRQVRTAQNENMKRVQLLYLLDGDQVPEALAKLVADEYRDLAVVQMTATQAQAVLPFFSIDDGPVLAAERIYFIDPLGNLMMYYAPDAGAGGMLKDLQKLLKFSKIG
jgi:cytochrome oxidase Cu insertion factor (SCO1/SenC/PrrC family)